VSGGCNHCLQPVLQHTIDHEHNASPPPILDLPAEGVEDWEATTNKTWTPLKLFVCGAFQRRLVAVGIHSTLVLHGYALVNNNYTMLANKFIDSDDDTIVKHTAAGITAGSMLGNMYAKPAPMTTMNNNLMLVINSQAANQQALYQHIAPLLQHIMATMLFHAQPLLQVHVFPSPNTTLYYVPPIQQHTIRGRPRGFSTLVHPRSLLVASTQDKMDVVIGAAAADVVVVAVAAPHLQIT
jgi:hypothetical protein